MKILINSLNHSPDLTGIGKYTGEMVEWLIDNGHEVRVVTAPPYYPEWCVSQEYSAYLYRFEHISGASIVRCPIWVPKQPTGLKRVVHLASFAITAMPIMLWQGVVWRPDVVFVVEPPLSCAPVALLAGWFARSKTWLHIQDFEIDAAFDLGMFKSQRLRHWITTVESWLMRRFDRVSTISVRMMDRLKTKRVATEKCLLFENWVDIDQIFPMNSKPQLTRELGLPEDYSIVLYSGSMGEKQGLELVIEAARRFQDRKKLIFLMCGTGATKARLEKLASNLANVRFIPLQPLEKLNELLNMANIHLLPQKSGAEDLVMPSKLTNMMASGKPVVATAKPDSQIMHIVMSCGIVVEPGNLDALCQAIEELVDDAERAHEMGSHGRKYAEQHWNMNNILSDVFSSICH